MPPDVFANKLARLTDAITERIGPPRAYRAGRWGLAAGHLRVLEDLGYEVDTSVIPLVNWRTTWGLPASEHGHGGVDFRFAPQVPYRPAYTDVTRPGTARILEVPVSVGFTHDMPASLGRIYAGLPLLVQRVLRKTELVRPVWATPAWEQREHLEQMTRAAIRSHLPVMNIALHSSEFAVGGLPACNTPEKIDHLYRRTEAMLEILLGEGKCEFLTLSAVARRWLGRCQMPAVPARDGQRMLVR